MTAHCRWCEAAIHIGDINRTALCDCCRKPVAVGDLSLRHWCRHCEHEFKVIAVRVRLLLRRMARQQREAA